MRLFIVGDFLGSTGPAVVNKTLLKEDSSILYSSSKSKLGRIFELIIKIYMCDFVVFSGLSKIDLLGFRVAKLLKKKSAYLMHGYYKVESNIEENVSTDWLELEEKVLDRAPLIICVSKRFMEFFKKDNENLKDKLRYIMNPIDTKKFENNSKEYRDNNLIMSVGGGSPRKNILKICEAINYINLNQGKDYKLIVIGKENKDTENIKKYKFVEYIENVPYEYMQEYYLKSKLYIQNSLFEPFGLATIEALFSGCNILISQNVGCRDIFTEIEDNSLIYDTNDISELVEKINFNMDNDNNSFLKSKIELPKDLINRIKEIISE